MYRNFFALSDLPFSISPDPKYLFMSDRHKEALSHLTYGLGEVGGFALLTGEVGTGKTTVSRCLMEQLPENTKAAFILNPMLSSQELLATLCDQLEIDYQKEDISLKNLTDKISEKLLENHEQGINTLLIIDEAQHLQPEVLEQLRLLTNLETNTKKLLQVILIGQPELQQLLQRRDLRQLAQRITARYHLMPLTKVELQQYIQHRLSIADCNRALFDKQAINKIHELTQGVPRLINLLCHSALMLAYNQNDSVVNKKTVTSAAEVVLADGSSSTTNSINVKNPLFISTVVSVLAFITLAAFWWGQYVNSNVQEQSENSNAEPNIKTVESPDSIDISKEANSILITENTVTTDSSSLSTQALKNTEQTENSSINEAEALQENNQKQLKPNVSQEYAATAYAMHTVKYGDTLYDIANTYNVPMEALFRWNNIFDGNSLSIGDKLHVSKPIETFEKYTNVSSFANATTGTNTYSQEDKMLVVSSEKPQGNPQVKRETKKAIEQDNFDIKPVDGVSDDLLALFQAAIDETENDITKDNTTNVTPAQRPSSLTSSAETIRSISQLPASLQNALPKMQFEQHIYASDGGGWVTVNGRDRYEGDYINNDLRVEEILPQQVILVFKGEIFTMPALTNW